MIPADSVLHPWWQDPLPEEVNSATGLSAKEARQRLARFGPNLFRERQAKSLLRQYLSRFKNPLVIILLVASMISAFTGEITNFVIISCIIILSVTLDFVQEFRANAAAEKLRLSVAIKTTVVRDGSKIEIPISKVVPGDIIMLSAGSLIPADGILLEACDFSSSRHCSQASHIR